MPCARSRPPATGDRPPPEQTRARLVHAPRGVHSNRAPTSNGPREHVTCTSNAPYPPAARFRSVSHATPLTERKAFMQLSTTHARRSKGTGLAALAIGATLGTLPVASVLAAEVNLPPVSVGAGIRTSFASTDIDGLDEDINDFALNSARIYLSGKATEQISLMFNTEYNSDDEEIRVIDAVAQFSFSDQFNIWAGRFLPPSDRANMYGPYYANNFAVFRDGVQDGYPFETEGRDDGVMYWCQFGIAKVSFGAFDVTGLTTGDSDVLYAGRVQLDFWDPEGGYYLTGTYYGDRDLPAVGVAGQTAGSGTAYSGDFLLEKKLGNGGVVSLEAEYAKWDGLGGYPSPRSIDTQPGPGVTLTPIAYDSSDGWYALGAYLFPQVVGIGRFQVLAKFGEATYDYAAGADVDQTTTEVDLNYIIRQFNARISLYYNSIDYSPSSIFVAPDVAQIGLGLQVQI